MMDPDDVLGPLSEDALLSSHMPVRRAVPPLRTPARLLVFKPAAQSETTSPVVDPQGVTYAADRFGARRDRGLTPPTSRCW